MVITLNVTLNSRDDIFLQNTSHNAPVEDVYLLHVQKTFDYINAVLILIAAPIIVTGNVMVIVSVARYRHLQTTMNLFVTSLAFADALVGVPTIPIYAAVYLDASLLHDKYTCLTKYSLVLLSCGASILNLLLVTLDRFIAVVYPLRYKVIMTKRRAKWLISGLWTYIAIVGSLPLLGINTWDEKTNNTCDFFKVLPFAMSFISSNMLTLLSLPAVGLMYTKIFLEAAANNRRLKAIQFPGHGLRDMTIRRETNIAKVMALVSLVFFVFWCPFAISSLLKHTTIHPISIDIIKNCTLTIAMFNSLLNPIIYCWMRNEFRLAFKKLLRITSTNSSERRQTTEIRQTTKCRSRQTTKCRSRQTTKQPSSETSPNCCHTV